MLAILWVMCYNEMESFPVILPYFSFANGDKFMGTVTQKFVIVLLTIVLLMVMNVILQQSEFTSSDFGNSRSQGRVVMTGKDSTFSPTVPSGDTGIEWTVSKPLQNEENGENILCDSKGENQTSTSLTLSAPQGGHESAPVLAQDFSKKNEKFLQKNFQKDHLPDSRKFVPSDIVKNAPWPFSVAGGKEMRKEIPSDVSPAPVRPLGSSRTVAVVERQRNSAKKSLSPSENELGSPESAQSPAPALPPEGAAASVALDPEPVLPPGYHVAPRGNNAVRSPAPVQASHEIPDFSLPSAPPQEVAMPALPPVGVKMRDFPPVEERTLRDFPPVEEFQGPGLLKAPVLVEEKAEMSPEKEWQVPDPIINDGEQGNFPLVYGEMELVTPNGYFGAEKPVTIPSVPEEREGVNDLLTIDAVVDLPEPVRPQEFPPVEKQ